jgi:hypothetical protein
MKSGNENSKLPDSILASMDSKSIAMQGSLFAQCKYSNHFCHHCSNLLSLAPVIQCEYNNWFYGAPTQFRSYGAKTGKMTLASLGCYKLKATPWVKITSPTGAKRCINSRYSNPFNLFLRSRRDKRRLQF